MDAEHFAGRLKELRLAKGWTQQQLAERAALAKATVADLEQDRYAPTWPTVLALADALGVTCEEFRKAPTTRAATGRGRPRKAAVPEGKPSGRRTGQRAKE